MKIRKAVVTAAGRSQRTLPLQSVIDRRGFPRSACQVFVEELASAGIEEIAIVICPGDAELFRDALGECGPTIHFIEQAEPLGYGHAILCAENFVGQDSFLLTVGDHLYRSHLPDRSCARQLIDLVKKYETPMSAVQSTHESKLPYFGAIGGKPVTGQANVFEVSRVREKPTPTIAEQELLIPGQRPGYYLCFFGMHVLPPEIMKLLRARLETLAPGELLSLSTPLADLVQSTRYLAAMLDGRRYDLGQPYGLLIAQLALALDGEDREAVLANLVELLAQTGR